MGALYIHFAGGTQQTLGSGFLMVATLSLLRAGQLGVLTIWGGVTEPLTSIFIVALLLPSRERERERKTQEMSFCS